MASDWQNAFRSRDVNNDKIVTPLDALIGINRLNSPVGNASLPARDADSVDPFFDVNGDQYHSPIDVLIVVNSLNGGLLVTSELVRDTGSGPEAGRDKLTHDASVRGSTQSKVDYLEVQINQQGPWHSLLHLQQPDNSFVISESELQRMLGVNLSDADYSIDIRAGQGQPGSELSDRTALEFHLDPISPQTNFVGDIIMARPDQIIVPLTEAIEPANFFPEMLSLSDVSWGENANGSEFGFDGNYPRFSLQPKSVTLADNGRAIVIEPPTNTRSIKYLIEFDGRLLQDAAGNAARPTSVKASYFTTTAPELSPGTVVFTTLGSTARILEYALTFPTNDVLVWGGNQSIQSRSRIELYDTHGQMVYASQPWTTGAPIVSQPAMWPVTAGQYRLRVVEPPVNMNEFQVSRLSSLPELPAEQEVQAKPFQYKVYQVGLQRGERLTMQSLTATMPPMAAAIGPLGQSLQLSTASGDTHSFEADMSGTFVVAVYGTGFRRWIAVNELRLPTSEPIIEGSLKNVGDSVFASFVTTPGLRYLFDALTLDPDLRLDGVSPAIALTGQDQHQTLFEARDTITSITVTRARAGASLANFKVRLAPLLDVSPLPLNTPIASPAVGQSAFYLLDSPPEYGRLMIEGTHRFLIVPNPVNGTALRSEGPVALSALNEGGILVRVQALADANPWFVRSVQTIRQSLTTAVPLPLTFTHGLERYELEFPSQAGQFYELELLNGQRDKYDILMLDRSGREIRSYDGPLANLWQASMSVPHRLVVAGRGSNSIGQLTLQVNTESDWPNLAEGKINAVAYGQRAFYRLPHGESPFYLNAFSAPSNSMWSVFDHNSRMLVTQPLYRAGHSQLQDLDLTLPTTGDHYLVVESLGGVPGTDLTFRWNATNRETRAVAINSTTAGTLASAGDSVTLRWNLQRGQFVEFSDLGIDRAVVSATWRSVDSPQLFNTDEPLLVPADGEFELQLVNLSSAPQNYAVTMRDSTANSTLGRGTAGFGTVREGTVEGFEELLVVNIQAEANTFAVLDWLGSEGNADLKVIVRKLTGEVIFEELAGDRVLKIKEAGAYEVLIGNQRFTPNAYRFVLRDLAAAPAVAIGQSITATIAPFEFYLARAVNTAVSDLVIVNNHPGLTPVMISTRASGQTGSVYAPGTLAVFLSNNTAASYAIDYSIDPIATRPLLELNQVSDVVLRGASTSYRFVASTPLTLEVKAIGLGAEFTDLFGYTVPRDERFFFIPAAGEYRLQLFSPTPDVELETTVELKAYLPEVSALALGTTVRRSIGLLDVHRYTFRIDTRSRVLLNLSFFERENVELLDDTGRQVNIYGENPTTTLPTISVQELAAGNYTLRIVGARPTDYSLTINLLSSATALEPGHLFAELGASESVRLYHVALQPGQALTLQSSFRNTAQFVTYLASDGHEPKYREFVPASADGVGQSFYLLVLGAGTTIELNMAVVEQFEFDLAADTLLAGTLPGPQTKRLVHVTFDSPDVFIDFNSSSASAWLLTPYGSRIPMFGRPLSGFPSGNYTLEIFTESQPASYRLSYQLIQNGPALSIGDATLVSGKFYRLELADDFRGRLLLQDEQGRPVASHHLEIWRKGMNNAEGTDTKFLAAGTYWVRALADPGTSVTYRLSMLPLVQSSSVAKLGDLVDLDLGAAYTFHRVKMAIPAGHLLMFSKLNLPDGLVARYRFLSPLIEETENNPLAFVRWNQILTWPIDGTLELEFEGTGALEFELMDLASAAAVSFGQTMNSTMSPTLNHVAWRLPVDTSVSFVIEHLTPRNTSIQWQLLDSRGNQVATPLPGTVWSIVNSTPLYLVASRSTDISREPIELSMQLAKLQQQ